MDIECTGRQMTVGKGLRTLVEEGAARIGKVLGKSASAHVILTAEKRRHIAEVNVKTRACVFVALCESSLGMEAALREALAKAESQAIRYKNKMRSMKRQPKPEKAAETGLAGRIALAAADERIESEPNGASRAPKASPMTVHSFPARAPAIEPHIVRSNGPVALRPMTLEEAVKEAEFRDHEVFVFRDEAGNVKILHRKRDGKMELIEVP